jgi:hypothetical protein
MEISGCKKCYFSRCFPCFSMRNCMLMDVAGRERKWRKSAPGRNRTCDLALRRHSLYPLSYRGRNLEAGAFAGLGCGGGEGDRTLDLRIANATLSQLSYSPEKGDEY